MTEYKATARAHANVAIAKYWGKRDASLNLPFVDSVSFNIANLQTETTAIWDEEDFRDALSINGWQVPAHTMGRMQRILDEIRTQKGWTKRCVLQSQNNFPHSTGLASSASGFAAAALAATKAAGLDYSSIELSRLARLGSGSASRSIPGGWVRWHAGHAEDGSDSYAESIAPAHHWPLHVFVVQISDTPKEVSSTDAMARCQQSPYWPAYLEQAAQAADAAAMAILQKDFAALRDAMHSNAFQLHALTLTCQPPICYFTPKSLELVRHVLRSCKGLGICCTMDAGANVVILSEETAYPFIKNEIIALGLSYIQSRIGGGAVPVV